MMKRLKIILIGIGLIASLMISACDVRTGKAKEIVEPPKKERRDLAPGADAEVAQRCAEGLDMTFLVDKTQSSAEELLKNEGGKFRQLISDLCPKGATVTNFGSDGLSAWHAAGTAFKFPRYVPLGYFDEVASRIEASRSCEGRLKCIDHFVRQQRSDWADKDESAYKEFKDGFVTTSDKVVSSIIAPSQIEPKCTDVNEIGDLILQSPSAIVIVVFDGKHDCASKLEARVMPPEKRVLILLTPLENEQPNGGFKQRMEMISQAFQNAKVKPLLSSSPLSLARSLN